MPVKYDRPRAHRPRAARDPRLPGRSSRAGARAGRLPRVHAVPASLSDPRWHSGDAARRGPPSGGRGQDL